ncbi:hypothetical protein EC968_007413, partial [Mortierella alpina]
MRITSAVLLSAAAAVACATQEHKPESHRGHLYARNRFADRSLADTLSGLLPGSRESATSEIQDDSSSTFVKRDGNDILGGLPIIGGVLRRGFLDKLFGGHHRAETPTEVVPEASSTLEEDLAHDFLREAEGSDTVLDQDDPSSMFVKRSGLPLLGGLLGDDQADTAAPTMGQEYPPSAYVKRSGLPLLGDLLGDDQADTSAPVAGQEYPPSAY